VLTLACDENTKSGYGFFCSNDKTKQLTTILLFLTTNATKNTLDFYEIQGNVYE